MNSIKARGQEAELADAEILRLAAEIRQLCAQMDEIFAKGDIGPSEETLMARLNSQADRHWASMMAIPAATQAGRAAKVRALLMHVCPQEWRGPASDLDREVQEARALLGQFAGMSEEELAAVSGGAA